MANTFMAGKVQGTKADIKKANKIANLICLGVIVLFGIATTLLAYGII